MQAVDPGEDEEDEEDEEEEEGEGPTAESTTEVVEEEHGEALVVAVAACEV